MKTTRKLTIATITAAALIISGALLFSYTQHYSLLDSMYWAVTTATTVGYGDVSAHNVTGKAISIMFMLIVIPVLAGAVAAITSSHMLSRFDEKLEKHHQLIHDHLNRIDPAYLPQNERIYDGSDVQAGP